MPIYLYRCPKCKSTFEDIQATMIGSRDIECLVCSDYSHIFWMDRNYKEEGVGTIEDWEPGYNVGIDEHYTSKADLMSKIRRKGLYPSGHGGGVVRSKAGLYGDEEYKNIMTHSEPEVHEGLDNVAPFTK